jgi:tetratricopeptide (TPR) repeat protein
MRAPVRKAGAALTGVFLLGVACTYYNAIYNAEHLFEEAERLRREGRDSLAAERYGDVIRKAADGFRSDPDGGWAYEASYLMGRAHLRRGDLEAARAALRHSAGLADDPDERLAAQVYEGVVAARLGHGDAALALFNEALAGAADPAVRGEGHLHRGRLLLERGQTDAGWWDLDRAASVYPPIRVEADLERLSWGIEGDDPMRVRESVRRLLSYPEAATRADALLALLRRAERRWGSRACATFLDGAEDAAWERDVRDRMVLEHARMLRRAGAAADADLRARSVADGRGPWAAEARVTLASWTLEAANDVGDIFGLRGVLLPAVDREEVSGLLADIERIEALAFAGLDDPLAWFLAGEIARDVVGAPRVARDLFLAYATSAQDEPWAPKALLAALQLTDDEAGRARLLERLERYPRSPYVLAARGRPAVGFEALEEELLSRLSGIRR